MIDYNQRKHITRDELSELLEVPSNVVTRIMRDHGEHIEQGVIKRKKSVTGIFLPQGFYDRTEAVLLVSEHMPQRRRAEPKQAKPANPVQAFRPDLLKRPEYKPDGLLAINLARTAKVYGETAFVSAGGASNGDERVFGYGRGS